MFHPLQYNPEKPRGWESGWIEHSAKYPFGIRAALRFSSFVVLDKSLLDGVTPRQLQYYVQQGWIFGIPEALMYEHFRKRDRWRIANIFKLHRIGINIVLPGIGEMCRMESRTLKPAWMTMLAKTVEFMPQIGPSGEYFELDGPSLVSTEERSDQLDAKLPLMLSVWEGLRELPDLKDASPKDKPKVIEELRLKIRDDHEDMRGFYAKHRHAEFPDPALLEENWAFFRWIQVQLLAGLDFIETHGANVTPNTENIRHELLDLDYLVPALLVGGLACREKRFNQRFKLLRPDGVILR